MSSSDLDTALLLSRIAGTNHFTFTNYIVNMHNLERQKLQCEMQYLGCFF